MLAAQPQGSSSSLSIASTSMEIPTADRPRACLPQCTRHRRSPPRTPALSPSVDVGLPVPAADLPAKVLGVPAPHARTNSDSTAVEPAPVADLPATQPLGSSSSPSTAPSMIAPSTATRPRALLPQSTRHRRSPLQSTPAIATGGRISSEHGCTSNHETT